MNCKFKVGQKVKVISERKRHWNDDGLMDRYFGRVVTISKILTNDETFDYLVNPLFGKDIWYWKESDFIPIENSIFSNDLNNGV